jgi:hypothetical protein
MEGKMDFRDRDPQPLSAGLFALGVGLSIGMALFVGLLLRGPGEATVDERATTNLTDTAFYRDTNTAFYRETVTSSRPNS